MTTTHIHPAILARILTRSSLYDLSANQLQALCELAASTSEALTMGGLARQLEISSAAVTTLADVLEKQGHITRHPSRTDRRTIWLILTDTGKKALTDILDA